MEKKGERGSLRGNGESGWLKIRGWMGMICSEKFNNLVGIELYSFWRMNKHKFVVRDIRN